jgi:hypothetical protein
MNSVTMSTTTVSCLFHHTQAGPSVSRRQITGAAGVILASALAAAPPAHALFGLGDGGKAAAEEYAADTVRRCGS